MDGEFRERSLTIEIDPPISDERETHTSIVVTAPTIGQRRQAEGHLRRSQDPEALTKFQVAMVARCTGIKEDLIEKLQADQFYTAWEHVAGFLSAGRGTGTS